MIVSALLRAIPGMINVSALVIIIWLIFAVLGVSFFKGTLFTCTNPVIMEEVNCVPPNQWVNNPNFSFDSTLTLFRIGIVDSDP